MFIGEYQYSLDLKRRLAIPSKFRRTFKGRAVITKGLDGCLFVYPVEVWKKMAEKLGSFPLGVRKNRQFVRSILSGAQEVELDKQGRVLIPQYLGKYAGLKKQVVLVGLYDRLELWDKGEWEKSIQKAEKEKDKTAEELGKTGIY